MVVERGGEQELTVLSQRQNGWRVASRLRVSRGIRSITWAPGGDKLAVSTAGGNIANELRVINLASRVQRTLASAKRSAPAAFFGSLAWSPDGRQIAATRSLGLYGAEVDILNASTGALIRPYHVGARFDSALAWSRDGTSLYFAKQPSERTSPTLWRLVLPMGKAVPLGVTGLDPSVGANRSLSFTATDGIRLLENGRGRKVSGSTKGDRFSSWLDGGKSLLAERPAANCPRYISPTLCSHVLVLTRKGGTPLYLLRAFARNPVARS